MANFQAQEGRASVARHCIVTRNAGARITYLFQHLVNQSREPGLERIRPLTLLLGQRPIARPH
jgi:hypothetical protein